MMQDHEKSTLPPSDRDRLDEHLARLVRLFRSHSDLELLARNVLTELSTLMPVAQAAFYAIEPERGREPRLRLVASHAASGELAESFGMGEGLVGQCALEKRKLIVTDVPPEHFRIRSGLGVSAPRQLTLLPVAPSGRLAAVLELASLEPLDLFEEQFLCLLVEGLGPAIQDLLPSFRSDPAPSSRAPATSARLTSSREAARYKPELFARMSHELRTPLNSLLVLSKMLADNADKNLTPKQMAFAQAIHASGNELLSLINELLELARIESNALSIEPAEMTLEHLREHLDQSFRHAAAEKGVAFTVNLQGPLPGSIVTDPKRLQHVLRSLLSKAFKLTERGGVSLSISPARYGWSADHAALNQADAVIAFGVSHTGAGSTDGERRAFADAFSGGSEGGPQCGLAHLDCTVSREIARLLGGELRVANGPGSSAVTLYLPTSYRPSTSLTAPAHVERAQVISTGCAPAAASPSAVEAQLASEDVPDAAVLYERVILTAEGDGELQQAAAKSASQRGYRPVTTSNIMAEMAAPTRALPAAILLDARSRDLEGWIVLDRLRQDPGTRHIPVAVLAPRDSWPQARRMGAAVVLDQASPTALDVALDELEFYAAERPRRVLFIQLATSPGERDILSLVRIDGVESVLAQSVEQGVSALGAERFHACVVSFGAAAPKDLAPLRELAVGEPTPIIVYAARPLEAEGLEQLQNAWGHLTLKCTVSLERLLHELSLCLYRPEAAFPSPQRHVLAKAARQPPELAGMRVLLVDADVRNVFAMTSALERHGVLVSYADNVPSALSLIEREPSIGALLADAGLALENDLELLHHLRRARHPALPFIALTSEPRQAEREHLLRAGASHYATKPIAARHLISVLRVASADGSERGLAVCR